MKVMVVDDSPEMRQMICAIIGDAADTCECDDGSQATAAYAEHCPDWVLMDIKMPQTNGIAATRLIRSFHPQAKIVIVTSHDSREMREEARDAGACAYVLKENLMDLRSLLTFA
jgi:CheY-like chemotaxis protein